MNGAFKFFYSAKSEVFYVKQNESLKLLKYIYSLQSVNIQQIMWLSAKK